MTPKRFVLLLVLALVTAAAVVSSAPADDFADGPCFDISGPDTATCPAGTVGVPYDLTLLLADGSGCGPGFTTWKVSSGTFPPGLTLSSDEGRITGTPILAGNFNFYVTVSYPVIPGSCNGGFSDKKLTLSINPGVPPKPKLTIGPETTSPGTVGTPYSLAMTANLPDAKTWSINAGTLPPGLTIDASTGLISGTPTATGDFPFTVLAMIDASTSDTKSLRITVRDALVITGLEDPALEVGVGFKTALKGSGGLRTYKWALTTGELPPGLTFWPGGAITGRPTTAGDYDFTVTLTDIEGRTATYEDTLTVADRLVITTTLIKGKVGRALRKVVNRQGGVEPDIRLKRGPLPPGVRFDRATVSFVGVPKKAGTWTVIIQGVDALKVRAKSTIVIVIAPGKRG